MKKAQVFVRAKTPSGRWVSADFLDLTTDSKLNFLCDMLCRCGVVVHIKDEAVEGERIRYETREEIT